MSCFYTELLKTCYMHASNLHEENHIFLYALAFTFILPYVFVVYNRLSFSIGKPRTSLRQPEYQGRQGRASGRTGSMRETQTDGRGNKVHNTPPNTPTRRGSLTSDRYERIECAAESRLPWADSNNSNSNLNGQIVIRVSIFS